MQILPDQRLANLDRIERRAFAQIVRDNPKAEAERDEYAEQMRAIGADQFMTGAENMKLRAERKPDAWWQGYVEERERLAVQAEREACAAIARELLFRVPPGVARDAVRQYQDAIRARTEEPT